MMPSPQATEDPMRTPAGVNAGTAPRSSRFSSDIWAASPQLSNHHPPCCGGDLSNCPRCGASLCLIHAFPLHMVTCGEDVEEPLWKDRCFVSNCQDPYNVVRCEKCPIRPVGHYFACSQHIQEHLDDCHSYKRAASDGPEAADIHRAVTMVRSCQAAYTQARRQSDITTNPDPKRARMTTTEMQANPGATLRMGSGSLHVGSDYGGRGRRGGGSRRGPPPGPGRPMDPILVNLVRNSVTKPIFVPNSGGVRYRIPPDRTTYNYRDQPRSYAEAAGGNRGGPAPLGGPLPNSHITPHDHKAATGGTSPP